MHRNRFAKVLPVTVSVLYSASSQQKGRGLRAEKQFHAVVYSQALQFKGRFMKVERSISGQIRFPYSLVSSEQQAEIPSSIYPAAEHLCSALEQTDRKRL